MEKRLHAKENRRRHPAGDTVDYPFLILVLLLLAVGLVMLYSASSAQSQYDTGYAISTRYLQKQGVCAIVGLGAMYAFSRIPVGLWHRLAWPMYGASIYCHKKGIIRKPPFIFCKKLLIIRIFTDIAALIGLSQNRIPVLIQLFIVDGPFFGLCFQFFTFLFCKNTFFNQVF